MVEGTAESLYLELQSGNKIGTWKVTFETSKPSHSVTIPIKATHHILSTWLYPLKDKVFKQKKLWEPLLFKLSWSFSILMKFKILCFISLFSLDMHISYKNIYFLPALKDLLLISSHLLKVWSKCLLLLSGCTFNEL